MKTKIFKSYADFLKREDKRENGVSEDFAEKYTDFEEQNQTNTGCWNCYDCLNCYNCVNCYACDHCENCSSCYLCDACKNRYN